jgi:hypothetical protein
VGRASLQGVEFKLYRAQEHLRTLVKAQADFLRDPKLCSPVLEINKQRRPFVWVEEIKEPPPDWGPLMGDCIHNLRSALDHLAFQLMVANSRGPLSRARIKTSAFPITTSSTKFRGAQHKLAGVSGTAKAIIEELQPYHRRKYPGTRTLWELEELWSGDKHRVLPLIYSSFEVGHWRVHGSLPFALTGMKPGSGRLKQGAVIARWAYVAAAGPMKMRMDCDLVTDIDFGKGRLVPYPVRGRSVVRTLYGTLKFIAEEVVPPLATNARLPFEVPALPPLVMADKRSPRTVIKGRAVRRGQKGP